MATERLQVILEMAAGQYKREAREAATATGSISKQAKSAATETGTLQTRMVGFGSVLRGAAVTGGVLALGRGLASTVENAERINSIAAITTQVIQQTGGAANVTADQLLKMSDRLEVLTGVESELVQEGGNVLLTFRNIANQAGEGNDIFDRTLALMLDIGAVMGTDTTSAALQLGKALNDPVSQMGALSRAGLTFSAVQKQQIKDLVANNDLLSAQKIILSELETQLGGTAEASVDASDKITNAVGRITDAVGLKLLPFLEAAAIELENMVGATDELDRVAAHADGAAESAEAFLTVVADQTGGAGFLNGVMRSIEDFATFLAPGVSRMERFQETLEALVPRLTIEELHRARNGIDQLGEELGLTRSEIDLVARVLNVGLARAMQEAAENANETATGVGNADVAMRNMARRGGAEARNLFAELGLEAETATPDIYAMRDAVAAVNTAMLEAASPIVGAVNAYQRYQEKLAEVDEDGERTSLEMLELAEAALEANAKIAELGSGNLQAGIQALADALGEPYGVIQDMLEDVGILDGTEVNLLFTASMPAADRALINSVNTATSGAGGVSVRAPDNIRHSGGPGTGGQAYLIKPNEEIFVPSGSGEFLLNDQVIKALRGLANNSTHNYNITVPSSGNGTADAQLAGSIASVLRRMETL